MAEQKDDKFNLPLVGVLALMAVVSGFIVYQNPLKTSRPIDQEAERKVASQRVQSRLWQDPFEAVKTNTERLKNAKSGDKIKPDPLFIDLIKDIRAAAGESTNFRIFSVFVDGNPYAHGVQSRLKDRYAVVSALGAAGYTPESGEYIRYFMWTKSGSEKILVPVERFIPKAKIQVSQPQNVLVLWLKDQDFSEKPLKLMNKLIDELRSVPNGNVPSSYTILGPKFSGTLSAMLTELQNYQAKLHLADLFSSWAMPVLDFELLKRAQITFPSPWSTAAKDFEALRNADIYSYWPTAEDTFLLDDLPGLGRYPGTTVEKLFELANISLIRTIGTDAILAEQLVNELRRRKVDLSCINQVHKCTPHIALISEWDTLYGRALPRTFVAVAENMAEKKLQKIDEKNLKNNIDKLRNDDWPLWVSRYSYLAGLDGELPPEKDSKETSEARSKDKKDDEERRTRHGVEVAEGRDQLDYVQRLAAELKRDEQSNSVNGLAKLMEEKKEFQAIGVLGGDVYDKLLIFQALRKKFPRAIFFTMDLDARLIHPAQWQWTRNVIIASHFGLQLHPEIQRPIPPFRDNSQTVLFYSVLRALGYLRFPGTPEQLPRYFELASAASEKQKCAPTDKIPACFSTEIKPKLYEIGRHGAVDISHDLKPGDGDFPSIHPARPDMDYSVLRALGYLHFPVTFEQSPHFELASADQKEKETCFPTDEKPRCFSTEVKPRLYEIGRHGAVDISHDLKPGDGEFPSIHPARPDLDKGDVRFPVETETIIWGIFMIVALGLCAMLISSEVKNIFGNKVFWLIAVFIVMAIVNLVEYARRDGTEGEPFVLTEGVSVWPTVAIHLVVIILCVFFYWYSRKILKDNDDKLSTELPLPKAAPLLSYRSSLSQGSLFSIPLWHHNTKGETDVAKLWEEYRLLGGLASVWRILPQFLLFYGFFVHLLFWKLGYPTIPCRGTACFNIYQIIAYSSVATMILLMLYVIDTTRLSRRFVTILREKKFPWRDGFRMYYELDKRGVDKEYLKELLCINLIAKWTAVISNLLYFPFIILFLISVARYSYIDNFDLPVGLVMIYGIIAAYAVGTVVALRISAEKAKRVAIEQLEGKLANKFSTQFSHSLNSEERKRRQQVEKVIKDIQENHDGAFLPFTKYPVLGAIAVPAGGTGLLYLIEYLVTAF